MFLACLSETDLAAAALGSRRLPHFAQPASQPTPDSRQASLEKKDLFEFRDDLLG